MLRRTDLHTHRRRLSLACGCAHLLLMSAGMLPQAGCQKPSGSTTETPTATTEALAPRQILDKMVDAYRGAKSYRDEGTLRFVLKSGAQDVDRSFPLAVAMARPNRLRLQLYSGVLACDGVKLRGTVEGIEGQVLEKDAPAQLSLAALFTDPALSEALYAGPGGPSAPLMFMLMDNPINQMLRDSSDIKLLDPAEIEGRACHRVAFSEKVGATVLWIDRQNFLLRRAELPVEQIRELEAQQGRKVEEVSIVAEYAKAELNGAVPDEKFRLDAPASARTVSMLIPPSPALLLGKKLPDFKFLDAQRKPITADQLSDKVTVFEFWGMSFPPCRTTLPKLQAVYEKYKSNPRVSILAVSVDPPEVPDAEVAGALRQMQVAVPLARDVEAHVARLFLSSGIPTRVVSGPSGLVEDFEIGVNPDLERSLSERIDKLLAGSHLYEEALKKFEEQQQRVQQEASKALAQQAAAASPAPAAADAPGEVRQTLPATKIAEATKPAAIKLKSIWTCKDLKNPGNILIVPGRDAQPRLAVLDDWRSVAELSTDGKVLSRAPLAIPEPEVVSFLQTAQAADGRRYYLGWSTLAQQVHLFDEHWKTLLNFPADALENKHAGISDTLLADLDGSGKLLLYVAYWGTVGVQAVSLEGKRVWANRSLENVLYLALAPPDAQGKRLLMCLDVRGRATLLDAQGQRKEEVAMGPTSTRVVQYLRAADLNADGKPEYCGVAQKELGDYTVLGLDASGRELWSYPLPKGHPQVPVEWLVPGNVSATGPGQWLVPAADGSLHILGADGKPVDRFNYGAAISGVGSFRRGGKAVLLIASPQSIEALEVQ